MGDLRDEPFLALPESTGPLRGFWLGEDARGGRPARVATVVHGPEEVVEALGRGIGAALIAAGNAEIYRRPEYVVRPVPGLAPAQLAVVWRADDPRPAVRDLVAICVAQARRARPTFRRDWTGPTDDGMSGGHGSRWERNGRDGGGPRRRAPRRRARCSTGPRDRARHPSRTARPAGPGRRRSVGPLRPRCRDLLAADRRAGPPGRVLRHGGGPAGGHGARRAGRPRGRLLPRPRGARRDLRGGPGRRAAGDDRARRPPVHRRAGPVQRPRHPGRRPDGRRPGWRG